MTKTAKEIIRHHLKRVYFNGSTDMVARQNGVIPNDTKLGETQIEVELDQAIKEIEAIMSAAAPPAIDTPSRIKIYADGEGQMWYDRGQNDTIKRYEANLKQALYGKED